MRDTETTQRLAIFRARLSHLGLPARREQRRFPASRRLTVHGAWYTPGNSGARTCTFTSYEQCMMTAGPGTGGSCIQNPWFL